MNAFAIDFPVLGQDIVLDNGKVIDFAPLSGIRTVRIDNGVFVDDGVFNDALQSEAAPEAGPPADEQALDIDAILEDARLKFQADAELKLKEALEAQAALFAGIMHTERAKWVDEEATRLSETLDASVNEAKRVIEDKLAAVLEPFMSARFLDQAIHEAGELIMSLLNDGSSVEIHIRGPGDLIEALKCKISPRSGGLHYHTDGGMGDISVSVNEALIETKFAQWCKLVGQNART